MKRVTMYRDTETGELISREKLKDEYTALRAAGETESESFAEYVENCTSKNGTLEVVTCA